MPSESSASGSKDRARIAIIGAGWWAVHNHIPAALKTGHADLAAVCRIGAKELAEVQRASVLNMRARTSTPSCAMSPSTVPLSARRTDSILSMRRRHWTQVSTSWSKSR